MRASCAGDYEKKPILSKNLPAYDVLDNPTYIGPTMSVTHHIVRCLGGCHGAAAVLRDIGMGTRVTGQMRTKWRDAKGRMAGGSFGSTCKQSPTSVYGQSCVRLVRRVSNGHLQYFAANFESPAHLPPPTLYHSPVSPLFSTSTASLKHHGSHEADRP